ncbi:MAG: helix-turn-helix domain-containing protein [Actinomycetota bacterium]|nr:helix-turn-helix domain-containing protein [Actinomycetota bacterium]
MQPGREHGAGPKVAPVKMAPPEEEHIPTTAAGTSDGLLDYQAAARYLCTTARHVRELWARRQLAAIKVGRSVRFTKADLDAFIAANRVRAVR